MITIVRNKLDKTLPYSVEVQLSISGIAAGTISADLAGVSITTIDGVPVTKLNVDANVTQTQLKVTLPKSMLDNNPGKLVAFNLSLVNLVTTKFSINDPAFLSSFVVDVEGFKELGEDVTSTYILNPGGALPFERSDAETGQFGTIKDWKRNLFIDINNTTLGKRGFSTNNEVGAGYMYAARLSGDAKPTEGKIWQNITLPGGRYLFEMDIKEMAQRSEVVNNGLFLGVTDKDTLPGTGLNNPKFPGNISECIAYSKINYETFTLPNPGGNNTNYQTNYTFPLTFLLTESKTVALGIIITYQNTNPYFLCRGLKLKKYVLKAFD